MAPDGHRLFFALWPDVSTRGALGCAVAALRSRRPEARGRWVAAERYHVTLQFLGGQPGPFPDALARSAAGVATALWPGPAFDLRIDVAGCFGGRGAPWWLGTSRVPDALRDLWQRLGDALREAGLPHDERADFTPHVTVLRDAPCALPTMELGDASLDWTVSSFALMHSRTGGPSPGYAVVGIWPLHAVATAA